MSSPVEDRLLESLHARAEAAPTASGGLAQAAERQGRRIQNRRRAGRAGAAVLAVGIAATVAGSVAGGPLGFREAPPAGRPTTPTVASSSTPVPTVSPSARTNDKGGKTYEITRCSTLKDSDLPRDTSYDTNLDRDRGLVTLTFSTGGGVDRRLTVDYVRDAACTEPGRRIGEIIDGALRAG
jgi:hypothetical protein